jgi:hypothetical protein
MMRQLKQLIAASTVSLFAMTGIMSCTARPDDFRESAAPADAIVAAPASDPSVTVEEAPPTPIATPSMSVPPRLRGGNFIPDRPNYSKPATPGNGTP